MRNSEPHDPLPALSKAEWEVMNVLWPRGEMAARDVFAAMPTARGWAYNTVKTLLSRLVAKGAVAYRAAGNSYLYRAACAQDEMAREEARGFLGRALDGAAAPLVAHFIEEADLTREEIAGLKKLLDEKARRAKPGAKGGRTR